MAREINLVPDIKGEMIKTLKLRNFILFLCIVVASASVAVSIIFAVIAGGQQAIADGKKNTLDTLSKKINSYSDLGDFLTIKDQFNNLSSISNNKKLLSRAFSILPALLPTGANTITVSELKIDLSADEPTISFDAQANSGEPPYIDYAVLESFKKSMRYMRYDYGDYVDKEGSIIPAYCIIESGTDGATFYDQTKSSYYAFWLITGDGCNPTHETGKSEESENDSDKQVSATELAELSRDYTTEEYNGQTVVRIWRTPQYNDWYKNTKVEGEPYMDLEGNISNVAHFESKCTTYSGNKNSKTGNITWSSSNESCLLVPSSKKDNEEDNGIKISNSSNGRGSNEELVLRFSAVITFTPEFFKFDNHHMIAIGPTGRHNVTDSYVQIQNMFEQRASDCPEDDASCNDNTNGGN